jgi:Flp pilus assembly protein TadG
MSVRRISRRVRTEQGQSLVEFALALPVLMLVILGMVDFGIAFNYNNDESNLANEAIRFAVVNKCGPCTAAAQKIETYVRNDADSDNLKNGGTGVGIQSPGVQVEFCSPKLGYNAGDPLAIGDPLKAKVTANYRFLPYVIATTGIPSTVQIGSSVVQRVEAPYSGTGYPTDTYTVAGPC